ncbi:endolytic transglycosylase MltG [Hydrogenothermus marinus]|uniref:Endolytic murein transglycosylase n=1 Tax=Hydrogenothermus marinus TaxID=133270 RepID=A0A3M0B9F4_9AQUI|nr:endolytic transglycosylase MltG [Hydrogenothermus marinus]RMA93216.1 UPF0755 protein [Hydrogenothermus marinus]
MKRFLIFLIILTIPAFFYIFHIKKPVNSTILIKKGDNLFKIADNLKNKDIISSKILFLIYSKIRNKPLKAGYYEFKGDYSISDVWYVLYKGKEKLVKITINAGNNLFDIAKKLENKGIIKKDTFLKYAFDKDFLKSIGIDKPSFEGYIYPDTYYISKISDVEEIFNMFFNRFKKEYKEFNINDEKFYKYMIVASLIEKESSKEDEKRIIAGIIYKRLKMKMPIQIDASNIYGLKLKGYEYINITKQIYKIDSPFNTYKHYGLPPTPICNFSKKSFYDAINPAKTDYLYYFSKDGKTHIFSKTYKEHLRKLKNF